MDSHLSNLVQFPLSLWHQEGHPTQITPGDHIIILKLSFSNIANFFNSSYTNLMQHAYSNLAVKDAYVTYEVFSKQIIDVIYV